MNVILINGSPRKDGNTYNALKTFGNTLEENGIVTEIIQIGNNSYKGCQACGYCRTPENKSGECTIKNDNLNEVRKKVIEANGIVIGSPVYYAGINGTLKVFLDRLFFTLGDALRFKPCAAVVAARRGGTTAALQTINQYFEIAEMLITPSVYWNGVHGKSPGESLKDEEGMQMMRVSARNMAYLLKLKEESNLPLPEKESKIYYNYIR